MNYLEIYKELNINSEEELLSILPRRYEFLTPSALKSEYNDKEKVILKGKLASSIQGIRSVSMLRFSIQCENYTYKAYIFGQDFYKNIIKRDMQYLFIGRYSLKQKAFSITSIIRCDNEFAIRGIKPIYSIPKKVKQADYYKLIKETLFNPNLEIKEVLPKFIRNKYRLESRKQAFIDVHLPVNSDSLKAGLRVFKYEEALKYALNSLCSKEYVKSLKKVIGEPINTNLINSYVKDLPYTLTHDQVVAIREIVNDMNKEVLMNRLLEGDVGTGKTAVAFAALYANYIRNFQGAFMAPTITLAKQHYENACNNFKKYGIKIALYDSSLPKKEKDKLALEISEGKIDIIIGTHSLITSTLNFYNLGLAIIDEQHRFGVMQRTNLAKKGESTDLLMMSATPIPRTLSKIMFNDIEVSTLNEFPSGGRCVKTIVKKSSDEKVRQAVSWATRNNRQIFVVVPKIEDDLLGKRKYSVKQVYDIYVDMIGESSVGLLHGKMKETDKDEIYAKFKKGEISVLVSTTVIEVGIDVPTAGLMIVYDANYFGLATLHQLRGRIGRDGNEAYAILLYDGDDDNALERLNFLKDNQDGSNIALYDLQNRGAGSYIGENQTGESDLKVANFVSDRQMFLAAIDDAKYIYEHLDNLEFNVYYNKIRKEIYKTELK